MSGHKEDVSCQVRFQWLKVCVLCKYCKPNGLTIKNKRWLPTITIECWSSGPTRLKRDHSGSLRNWRYIALKKQHELIIAFALYGMNPNASVFVPGGYAFDTGVSKFVPQSRKALNFIPDIVAPDLGSLSKKQVCGTQNYCLKCDPHWQLKRCSTYHTWFTGDKYLLHVLDEMQVRAQIPKKCDHIFNQDQLSAPGFDIATSGVYWGGAFLAIWDSPNASNTLDSTEKTYSLTNKWNGSVDFFVHVGASACFEPLGFRACFGDWLWGSQVLLRVPAWCFERY